MYQELAARLDAVFRQAKDVLVLKEEVYGDSWKKRGGVGAFMMLARKWDRIEIAVKKWEWDVFEAIANTPGLLDDIQDLRNYLTLVEDEATRHDERREDNAVECDGDDRKKYRGELT